MAASLGRCKGKTRELSYVAYCACRGASSTGACYLQQARSCIHCKKSWRLLGSTTAQPSSNPGGSFVVYHKSLSALSDIVMAQVCQPGRCAAGSADLNLTLSCGMNSGMAPCFGASNAFQWPSSSFISQSAS